MAAAKVEKLAEHFLTCSICTEIFRDPATLKCQHSFCRLCLTRYIKTRPEAIQTATVPCPLCRQLTDVPNPKQDIDDWISQIKPGLLIQNLLDEFGSEIETNDPGTSNQLSLEKAKTLPLTADEVPIEEKVTGHYTLPVAYHPETLHQPEIVRERKGRRIVCKEHGSEQIAYLCKDCNKGACQICISQSHKECQSVVTIEAVKSVAIERMRSSKRKLQNIKRVDSDARFCKEHTEERILYHCKNCNERICHVCITEVHLQCKLVVLINESDKLTAAVGDLSLNRSHFQIPHDTITVRTPGDKFAGYPTDLEVLIVHGTRTFVVSDSDNLCIKSFSSGGSCHSRLSLTSYPCSITKLIDNKVAVLTKNHNEILILDVTPDLFLRTTTKIRKGYTGFAAFHSSKFAAIGVSPACVDIINMDGKVLKSFRGGKDLPQLSDPWYISTTSMENIIVSDQGSHSVFCLTTQGSVVFTYSPTHRLMSPRGITTTGTGCILVADFHSNKILQLSSSGQFVRDVLTSEDGILEPLGLRSDKRNNIYVSAFAGEIKAFCFS